MKWEFNEVRRRFNFTVSVSSFNVLFSFRLSFLLAMDRGD
jgi:hypothetical protein